MRQGSEILLLGLDREAFAALVEKVGEPAYRSQQLMEAVYRQRVQSIAEISTLPQQLRQELVDNGIAIGLPQIQQKFVSQDGTVRYLVGLADGQSVETVWMPEGDGGEAGDGTEAGDSAERSGISTAGAKAQSEKGDPIAALKRCATQNRSTQNHASRNSATLSNAAHDYSTHDHAVHDQGRAFDRGTICVSSQVGCAVECQFCLTALLGLKRNLTAGEIVGQVCAVLNDRKVSPERERINLVFMGMGEPFLNYENFMKAVRLLVEEVGIAESRMTVSTAGIVPRIHEFGLEAVRPKLAISLNASNDELRTRLMPLNKKWNLEQLMAAARDFPLRNRERLTFEYVLLRDVNDSPRNADEVAELLRGLRAKVNLIALNPGPGIDFATPESEAVAAFQKTLMKAGIPAFVRRPRGRDIYAACGQLKRTVEVATAPANQPQ